MKCAARFSARGAFPLRRRVAAPQGILQFETSYPLKLQHSSVSNTTFATTSSIKKKHTLVIFDTFIQLLSIHLVSSTCCALHG